MTDIPLQTHQRKRLGEGKRRVQVKKLSRRPRLGLPGQLSFDFMKETGPETGPAKGNFRNE
jgi:hypothetical protein